MDRVGKALDHKYVSRAGNLSFLVGIALFVYGKIADASLEVWILVLLVVGVLFMAFPYMGRLFERWAGRSKSKARKAVEVPQSKAVPERKPSVIKKQKPAPKPAPSNYRYLRTRLRRAKAAFETELVVLIDEWKQFATTIFGVRTTARTRSGSGRPVLFWLQFLAKPSGRASRATKARATRRCIDRRNCGFWRLKTCGTILPGGVWASRLGMTSERRSRNVVTLPLRTESCSRGRRI